MSVSLGLISSLLSLKRGAKATKFRFKSLLKGFSSPRAFICLCGVRAVDSSSSPRLLQHTSYWKTKTNSKTASVFQVEESLLSTRSSIESKGRTITARAALQVGKAVACSRNGISLWLTLTTKTRSLPLFAFSWEGIFGGFLRKAGTLWVHRGGTSLSRFWVSQQPAPGSLCRLPARPTFAKLSQVCATGENKAKGGERAIMKNNIWMITSWCIYLHFFS